jgi:hypothetical protein
MKYKTLTILTIVTLCLSIASMLAPPLASPAQASPMETLHLNLGPATFVKSWNQRSPDLQPGDEIIQFTQPNLTVGTNPVASYLTVGVAVHTVSGDLSGTITTDFNRMAVRWDELPQGTWKGYSINTGTFDDGQGNTFSGVGAVDFLTSSEGTTETGYSVAVSGTGTFSGQILIGTASTAIDGTKSITLRRYSNSEVSGPQPFTITGTSTLGNFRSLGPGGGPQPSDEFVQFTRNNISIPAGDPVTYLTAGTTSSSCTGALTGTMTHSWNQIRIPGTNPTNQGWAVTKFSYSDSNGTINGVQVGDSYGDTIPPHETGRGYMFAPTESGVTGAYAGKDFYITYDMIDGMTPSATANMYVGLAQADNTPVGGNVTVSLPGAVVTFDTVTASGNTSVNWSADNPAGPTPPNFYVRGLFTDISTTAIYTGPVNICIDYDESGVANENSLRLFHWNGALWEDVTTPPVDTINNIICGNVTTLSPFFVGEQGVPVAACFIATAAYGTPMAEEVEVLREFRDTYLLTNPVGKALVELYYRVSPPMAEFITEHPALKPIVRGGLMPAMVMSTVAVNTSSAEKMAILGSLALVCIALAIWVRQRARRLGRGR